MPQMILVFMTSNGAEIIAANDSASIKDEYFLQKETRYTPAWNMNAVLW